MVRIVSDTSTLYSSEQARNAGFDVSPLSVTIANKTYLEFDEISSEDFVAIIKQGNMPVSSQPAIGSVHQVYEKYAGEEIINISMAMGLSGTYNSAVAAADMCSDEAKEKITVINTRTLCGPHRYMVDKAVKLSQAGQSKEKIVAEMNRLMDSAKSYLIPDDFEYLRRGGRLSPLVSYVGKTAGLAPIMTQTEDGCRLTVASVRRGFSAAINFVAKALASKEVGKGWKVYITHAAAPEKAQQALKILQAAIPDASYEIHLLSPAFITQGGPGCVAVQYVQE